MADVRLIDANALCITNITERKHIFIDGKRRSTFVYGEVVRIKDLQNAPTIDAVQVVRCKDCKRSKRWCNAFGTSGIKCDLLCVDIEAEGFCSYGQRRGENE